MLKRLIRKVTSKLLYLDLSTVTIWIPDSMSVRYSNGGHMTWRTIWIPDILDHKQTFFSPVFRPPFEYQIILQPDTNLPFEYPACEYQTSPAFRWLLYLPNNCAFASPLCQTKVAVLLLLSFGSIKEGTFYPSCVTSFRNVPLDILDVFFWVPLKLVPLK